MHERLSGIDSMFVYTESAEAPMEVAYVCVLDPSTCPVPFSFEHVRRQLEERLPLIPPFRRTMVGVPLGIDHPRWVDDPDFDLSLHLRRAALPAPGDAAVLADFAAQVLSRPLPADRPLWELSVVEGLEGGGVAVVAKVHHAAIDGVSGAELLAKLLDLEPTPAPAASGDDADGGWDPGAPPSPAGLLGQSLVRALRLPLFTARAAWEVGATFRGLVSLARRVGRDSVTLLPLGAPATTLSSTIDSRRAIALADLPLDRVLAVKAGLGVTVNDVVLELCAAALRRYLEAGGETPEEPLVAVVPVSRRQESERDQGGNRLSAMFVPLATDVDDPVARLKTIAEVTRAAKEQERSASFGPAAQHVIDATPPVVMAPAMRLANRLHAVERLRPGNLVISNIPGPAVELYFAGARMRAVYPFGPIVSGMGLNITVQSYTDRLFFGLNACPRAVPGIGSLAELLPESLDELAAAVGL